MARDASASASRVGGARVAARDGREVRVADLDRDGAAQKALALEPRRAVARHLVDLAPDLAMSVRSRANVFSVPDDFADR
jgi:hypothetical protein